MNTGLAFRSLLTKLPRAASWLSRVSLLVLSAALTIGCGGGDSGAGGSGSEAESSGSGEAASIKSYSAADLPEVGEPLRAMDVGRLVISAPTGWTPVGNQPKALVWLCPGEPTELPRIVINSIPAPVSGFDRVDETNGARFCSKLLVALDRLKGSMVEFPKPLLIGNTVWSRHVRLAKVGDGRAAIQSLQTVRGGRLYSIDLYVKVDGDGDTAYQNAIKKHRDMGYAVAASATFPKDEGGSAPSEEMPAEEMPAEETPAETPAEGSETPAEPAAE